ncbi:hypothetical protein BD309DRAFT_625787 [Dichomitus squalens]|nr:hypothetical protein BD309DRAFT_625787 [Dichomitus squalens]
MDDGTGRPLSRPVILYRVLLRSVWAHVLPGLLLSLPVFVTTVIAVLGLRWMENRSPPTQSRNSLQEGQEREGAQPAIADRINALRRKQAYVSAPRIRTHPTHLLHAPQCRGSSHKARAAFTTLHFLPEIVHRASILATEVACASHLTSKHRRIGVLPIRRLNDCCSCRRQLLYAVLASTGA